MTNIQPGAYLALMSQSAAPDCPRCGYPEPCACPLVDLAEADELAYACITGERKEREVVAAILARKAAAGL